MPEIAHAVGSALSWCSGHGRYMSLVHCMGGDRFWIALTVALDLSVALGYYVIVRHWARNERLLAEGPAKSALRSIKAVFIFCGVCGYIFIPVKMIWPAWRLYDLALIALAYYTWRYALGSQQLRVVYSELDRTAQLRGELDRSREDARRKSLFLNSVSHDIRTPLNGMSLQAELAGLCLQTGDMEGAREALDEIRRGARSAAGLLDEFLEIGRIDWSPDSIVREPVGLDEAIHRVVASLRAQAERKGLRLEAESAAVTVSTDRRIFGRILQNLIENAIKYTHEGGIRVVASAAGQDVAEIHVIDTGVGISEDHRALVFQEFYQVENRERDRTKGFGLGLSIASRLAAQLGGGLALESQPGRGSRFTLRLPLGVAGASSGPGVDPLACGDGRPSRRNGAPAETSLAR
jgi:signal transduction histidine kinase